MKDSERAVFGPVIVSLSAASSHTEKERPWREARRPASQVYSPVKDRFTSDDYPGVFQQAPKEVARTIVERFGKDHDDAACIAVRYAR